jgi:hypothetical protein
VSHQDEGSARAERDHHMIAGNGRDTCPDPLGLTECVVHESDLGPSRGMIQLTVMRSNDCPTGRRQDGFAEATEHLGRLDGEDGPPCPRSRSTAAVDRDEVDGIGDPEGMRSMAGYPSGWTVAC